MTITFRLPVEDLLTNNSLLQSRDSKQVELAHARMDQHARTTAATAAVLSAHEDVRFGVSDPDSSLDTWGMPSQLELQIPDEETAKKVAAIFKEHDAVFESDQDFGQHSPRSFDPRKR